MVYIIYMGSHLEERISIKIEKHETPPTHHYRNYDTRFELYSIKELKDFFQTYFNIKEKRVKARPKFVNIPRDLQSKIIDFLAS